MNQQESKATKYDWSNVPEEVQWIATDKDGWAWGWDGKPDLEDEEWNSKQADLVLNSLENWDYYYLSSINNLYTGDWRESLEQRPNPCAQCPNVGHKTCCCEVR